MNTERIIGALSEDETIALAKACLDSLPNDAAIQLLREQCLDDQDFCNELVDEIGELAQ